MVRKLFKKFLPQSGKGLSKINAPGEQLSTVYDVVLHIGAPKAGSSALQAFSLKNRQKLEQLGFYYPEHTLDVNDISGGHSAVGGPITKGDISRARSHFLRMLKEAKSKKLSLLLSAESFYAHSDALSELTDNLNVAVIGYFRDPLESLISNYNQSVKRHYRTLTLQEFVKSQLNVNQRRVSGMLLDDWIKSFGRDNVFIYPYDKSLFPFEKIEYSFLSALGINSSQWQDFSVLEKVINSSYSRAVLEVKRLLNYILDDSNSSLSHRVDWALQAYSDSHPEKRFESSVILGESAWKILAAKFSATNDYLKTHILSHSQGFLCYSAEFSEKKMEPITFSSVKSVVDESLKCDEAIFQELCKLYTDAQFSTYSSDIVTLGHLLDQPVKRFSIDNNGFTDEELSLLLADNPKIIDFYIKQGLMLERLGNYLQAKKFIAKAQQHRPDGKQIAKIAERLEQKSS